MALRLKRFVDDLTQTWGAMPKPQALRWYAAILRRAPTVLRERKFYSADHDMHGDIRFRMFGRDFTVNVDLLGSTAGNPYSFCRELFVRQIYFRAFKHLDFDTCLDLGCNAGVVTSVLKQLGGPQARAIGVDARTYQDNAFRLKAETIPGVTLTRHVVCGESIRHDLAALHAMCDPYDLDVTTAVTIEEVMNEFSMSHVNFVKMDIEGAEFAIFRDSLAWLDRVDNLAMEVHNYVDDPGEIIARLQQAGFRASWSDENGDPIEARAACYIYASKIGSLKN